MDEVVNEVLQQLLYYVTSEGKEGHDVSVRGAGVDGRLVGWWTVTLYLP